MIPTAVIALITEGLKLINLRLEATPIEIRQEQMRLEWEFWKPIITKIVPKEIGDKLETL